MTSISGSLSPSQIAALVAHIPWGESTATTEIKKPSTHPKRWVDGWCASVMLGQGGESYSDGKSRVVTLLSAFVMIKIFFCMPASTSYGESNLNSQCIGLAGHLHNDEMQRQPTM
ncbi:hypothetical protein HX890_10290 [Pseudomonas gingeri]|uniref:hypothetical protein n=1 Tax=Pseudomonas gingeri TaxID=117681 RepID=UPI0015A465D4|nr:hypothetical protein [Pseudomonas gingeri]NWD74496.1 hypothetical protein [Pseudomonas gingeri]